MQMYRVVPQTKRRNCIEQFTFHKMLLTFKTH